MADWDVVSGPGITALGLASARAVESLADDRLIVDPYALSLLDAVSSPVPFPRAWPAAGDPVDAQQALFLHGSRYIGLRTRFYDDHLLGAAAGGARQVVLLGSGLDTRAFRLSWPPSVALFELDQAAVLGFKDAVLGRLGARPACGRATVGVDLREDWPAALVGAGLDAAAPTAWVAEGVLAYLAGDAQAGLLERLDALSARGSTLALDRLIDDPGGGAVRRLSERSGIEMDALLHAETGFSPARLLGSLGWAVEEADTSALAAGYGRDLADPFGDSEPPWLGTMFLTGMKT